MANNTLNLLYNIFGFKKGEKVEVDPENILDKENQMSGLNDWDQQTNKIPRRREDRYRELERIQDFLLGESAINAFVNDAFPYDHERSADDPQKGLKIWVTSKNDKVKRELDLLHDRIGIDELTEGMAAMASLYGECFDQLLLSEEEGVVALCPISPYALSRVEDGRNRLLGFAPGIRDVITYHTLGRKTTLEDLSESDKENLTRPWDIVHTRIIGPRTRYDGYGVSLLQPVMSIWKQLKTLLDSAVLYRYTTGPSRTIYYVDTGTAPPEKQHFIVNMWRKYIKQNQYFNKTTGTLDHEWKPAAYDLDLVWPISKDNNSRIERLDGNSNVEDMADIKLYIDLWFAGTQIPKGFLGFEGDIETRETLPQQAIRYANVVYKVQRAILRSIITIDKIHLTLKGFDVKDPDNQFTVHTNSMTHLHMVAKKELMTAKFGIMQDLSELGDTLDLKKPLWSKYILMDYLGLSEKVVNKLIDLEEIPEEDRDIRVTMNESENKVSSSIMQSKDIRDSLGNVKQLSKFMNPHAKSDELGFKKEIDSILEEDLGSNEERYDKTRKFINKIMDKFNEERKG